MPVTYTVGSGHDLHAGQLRRQVPRPGDGAHGAGEQLNIPAVKLLDGVTVERMLEGAEAMGIHSLNRGKDWYGLSLTLGGGEVTLLELTAPTRRWRTAGKP